MHPDGAGTGISCAGFADFLQEVFPSADPEAGLCIEKRGHPDPRGKEPEEQLIKNNTQAG